MCPESARLATVPGDGAVQRGGQRTSWPVGRVLCTREKRGGGHPSRAAVAGSLVRSTREHRAGHPQSLAQAARPGRRMALVTLLQVGFTKPPGSLRALVVSYTTVSPLPRPGRSLAWAVCSLWHFPAGHPGSALPTTLPCGARTFLTGPWLAWPGAAARPARPIPKDKRSHPGSRALARGIRHRKPSVPERRPGLLPLADPPRPAAVSIAWLARRSAWVLRSRGTQV